MPSILIVDDDSCTCETLARGLRSSGFRAVTATTADAALDVSQADAFDLLLIDYLLGATTGLELVRRLRKNGFTQPFILMSGYMDVATAVSAMRAGALNALCAPLDIDELPRILMSDLERSRRSMQRISEDSAPLPICPEDIEYVPESAVGELARMTFQSCGSSADFPTVALHAHFVGVSPLISCW